LYVRWLVIRRIVKRNMWLYFHVIKPEHHPRNAFQTHNNDFNYCVSSGAAVTDTKSAFSIWWQHFRIQLLTEIPNIDTDQHKEQNHFSDYLPRDWHITEPPTTQYSNILIRKQTIEKMMSLLSFSFIENHRYFHNHF
jgi:hypothetical protein